MDVVPDCLIQHTTTVVKIMDQGVEGLIQQSMEFSLKLTFVAAKIVCMFKYLIIFVTLQEFILGATTQIQLKFHLL